MSDECQEQCHVLHVAMEEQNGDDAQILGPRLAWNTFGWMSDN